MHVAQIEAAFGAMPLAAVRPSSVRSWTVKLKAPGLADSYVYALHSRLSQIMSDAVHDGLLGRNPCSRRTLDTYGHLWPDSDESRTGRRRCCARRSWGLVGTERAGLR